MSIKGTAVAKFNSTVPICLQGEWNITTEVPAARFYGQGDGTAGSGYLGSTLGTKQSVSGSFKFIVDGTGEEVKRTIQTGQYDFFTIDWPLGDPALGATYGQAVDCHFDSLSFDVNNPDGSYIITGRMTAGRVSGEAFGSAS